MERVYLFGGKAAVGEDIFVLAALDIPPKAVCPLDAACSVIVIADKAADKAQVALRHEHIPVLVGYARRDADIELHQIFVRQRFGYNGVQCVDTLDYQHIVLTERYRLGKAASSAD